MANVFSSVEWGLYVAEPTVTQEVHQLSPHPPSGILPVVVHGRNCASLGNLL